MTFEEAKKILTDSAFQVGFEDRSMEVIELMKADAMQRQAVAIEKLSSGLFRLANAIEDCTKIDGKSNDKSRYFQIIVNK
jgi:hypothetical protein